MANSTDIEYNHAEYKDIENNVEYSIKPKVPRSIPPMLKRFHHIDNTKYELCIDEAGRGCLFGRVYIACVVLPKDPNLFSGKDIKDSKKFSSKRKIKEVSDYIKQHALTYYIAHVDEKVIDQINILQAVMRGMHDCIKQTVHNLETSIQDCFALIDGNYFTPYISYCDKQETFVEMQHVTVEQGDAKYIGIAAASILAKTARDDYVLEMCKENPELVNNYCLDKNMGYGTKQHLDGIRNYGVTKWHRRTFGICRDAPTVSENLV